MLNESPCEIDKIKVIKFLTHFTVAPIRFQCSQN